MTSRRKPSESGSDQQITREMKLINGLGECRIYTSIGGDQYPSVTTVNDKIRHDPEKERSLKFWRQKYDGTGDKEHHSDILKVKSHFGTLAHYYTLSPLAKADLWGDSERTAKKELQNHGEYEGVDAWKWAQNRFGYVREKFHQELANENIIDIIGVENFVVNTDVGYGGQYDLLYTRKGSNGKETVLCDLKTGSGIRADDELQAVAYTYAINQDIDRIKIIRAHPTGSNKSFETRTDEEFESSRENLYEEFQSYVREFHRRMNSNLSESKLDKSTTCCDSKNVVEPEKIVGIVDKYTGSPYAMTQHIRNQIDKGKIPEVIYAEIGEYSADQHEEIVEIIKKVVDG